MKNCWEYKKLKDVVALITDGDWIESRHQSEDGIRLIQTGNVGDGFFKAKEDKPHYISESTFSELGCTEIFEGDCLVSRLPEPVGRACLIPATGCRMITAVDCTIIRFKDIMLPSLFIYYTRSKRYKREIYNSTTGTTRKRISRKNLESIPIPVPTLPEQERIVAELDLLTGIIDKQKSQLKELDNLAQSIFYDMFGDPEINEKNWKVKTIGEVCDFINGFAFKSDKFRKEGLPVLRISNIQNDIIEDDDMVYFSPSDYKEDFGRYEVYNGDIVIAMSGATTGKLGVNRGANIYYLNQRVGKFEIKDAHVNSTYLFYYLKTISIQMLNDAMGVAQPNISSGQIKGYVMPQPPFELQVLFSQKIELLKVQKESINRSIAETQKLFDYTMDKYFG